MTEDLISKKELLELTEISYGQLYRWKRKKLVPDEWFIRKSTFTGQETFFPREKILIRIDKIKNMKDNMSLDEIANQVSPIPAETHLRKQDIIQCNIVSKVALELFLQKNGPMEAFSFKPLMFTFLIDQALESGLVNLDEAKMILDTLINHYSQVEGKQAEIIFIRKYGISSCLLRMFPGEIFMDKDTKVVLRMNLSMVIEKLKTKLSEQRGD